MAIIVRAKTPITCGDCGIVVTPDQMHGGSFMVYKTDEGAHLCEYCFDEGVDDVDGDDEG